MPGNCLVEASHKRSKVDGTIPRVGLPSSPALILAWTSSITPCKAASALCLPGWASCLPEKISYVWRHNSTCGLAKQPGFDLGLDFLHNSLQGCLSALLAWLGFLSAWKNIVLTWLQLVWLDFLCGWTSPLHGALVEATNEAKWMAQFHAWAWQSAQASISAWTSLKAAWKNIVLTWLQLVWLDLPAARETALWRPPTNEAKFHAWACQAAQASISAWTFSKAVLP